MEYTEVSLEKAFRIQRKECAFNMKELRGAIKAFFVELGYPDKEISMPKGETAGSWLDKLVDCINNRGKPTKEEKILSFLESQ